MSAMKPITEMSLRELLLRRDEVNRVLEQKEPGLVAEQRLLDQAIANFDKAGERPYARVKWPKDAIVLCLQRNRAWMTKAQIQHDLEVGGFVFNAGSFSGLLSDGLRYHASAGRIVRRDEHGRLISAGTHKPHARYPNEQFGLAEWKDDVRVGTFRPESK